MSSSNDSPLASYNSVAVTPTSETAERIAGKQPIFANRSMEQGLRIDAPVINQLTSIRGIAALAVCAFHMSGLADGWFIKGYLGVDLFFILSGFILFHAYQQNFKWRSFFLARFARTYPLHALTLMILLPAIGASPYTSPGSLGCNLVMAQAICGEPNSWNSVSWSLSAEWISYLMFPFFLGPLLIAPKWTAGILALFCVAALVLYCPITATSTHGSAALHRSIPEFLFGMTLYRAYQARVCAHWGYCTAATIAVTACLLAHLPDQATIVFLGVYVLSAPYVQFLRRRALVWLGEISFSLYMLQFLVGIAVARGLVSAGLHWPLLSFGIILLAVLVSAAVSYRYIEVPARRWIRAAGLPLESREWIGFVTDRRNL